MKRLNWQEVRPHIGDTLRDDEIEIKTMVESGEAVALLVGNIYIVGRCEGAEFVAMCVQGESSKNPLRQFYNFLKNSGFKSVRIHTHRNGLQKMLNNNLSGLMEFEKVETVYRGLL